MTRGIRNKRRIKNLIKTGRRCFYCGCKVVLATNSSPGPKVATVEHIYPKNDIRRSFVTEKENTVLACAACNEKTNRDFDGMNLIEYNGLRWEPYLIGILKSQRELPTFFKP